MIPVALQTRCRLHGPRCATPWGYDPEHTDSPRPYTVGELAEREVTPHRFAYPSYEAYIKGWKLWVALKRDGRLTKAEGAVKWRGIMDQLGTPEDLREHLSFLTAG